MSPDLIAFLKAWHDWATKGAPEGKPFWRDYGLCDNARANSYAAFDEMNALFSRGREEGLFECHVYPFGEHDFENRSATLTQHECPKRLAWVRQKLVEAGELVA